MKLNSDIRIIRNEHNEMAQSIFGLETKNHNLMNENKQLKDIVQYRMNKPLIDEAAASRERSSSRSNLASKSHSELPL